MPNHHTRRKPTVRSKSPIIPSLPTHLLQQPGTVLLETIRPDPENRKSLLFARPVTTLVARRVDEVPALLQAIDEAITDGYYVAGYLGYECGFAFEDIAPPPVMSYPLAWFGVYAGPLAAGALDAEADAGYTLADCRFDITQEAYRTQIHTVKDHIREGDVYQINFTDRLTFSFEGSAPALYEALKAKQGVAYSAYLQTDEATILSLSPELFFQREGRRIWTRPMKGTIHRGRTPQEDAALQAWLAADEKSRAENLMIVDLLRNDLSVLCEPGSVQVPDLFTTEPFETLIQMTSTVEGRLREDAVSYAEIFRALFPCGSVTGAPKIRAMQLIHACEAGPRGVYTGSIGYIAPNDRAVFNVAIRTVVLQNGHGEMGTGSGIVWDSDADAEYDECLLKARFLTEPYAPFELIETMRLEEGTIPLLPRHLDRMAHSARYFGFPGNLQALRMQLETLSKHLPTDTPYKVRALLNRDGQWTVTHHRLTASSSTPERVVWSDRAVDSTDPFFYHKTTRRTLYEDTFARAVQAGYDEALFRNERGEVTEACRSNVFIRNGKTWLTPPVESGLLAGAYRAHLLETLPDVQTQVLYPEDILQAEAAYLCNAVRGLREIEVVQ